MGHEHDSVCIRDRPLDDIRVIFGLVVSIKYSHQLLNRQVLFWCRWGVLEAKCLALGQVDWLPGGQSLCLAEQISCGCPSVRQLQFDGMRLFNIEIYQCKQLVAIR